jgi:hypothetical protein
MGFIDSSPSPTRLPLRPLPDEPSLTLRSGTATFQTRSVLAVPPGSDGLLRSETKSEDLASWQLAGLLHPAADRGVRRVSGLVGSEDPAARHPGGVRVPMPSSQALTLRSVLLPGSSLPSPRSPAFTGKHCPLVVDPTTVLPRSPDLDLEALLHRGVRFSSRSVSATSESMLPWALDRSRSCLPRVLRGRVRYPPARAANAKIRGAFPRPESPRKAKCLGFVWLRGPMSRSLPEGRDDDRRGPLAIRKLPRFPAASTSRCRTVVARWPGPKTEPWPRRRRIPEGTSDDSTAIPRNRRHHLSRCTRRCLDSGRPPAPPEGGPDDLQRPARGCYAAGPPLVSRAPPFVRCLIPEGTVLCTTAGLLGAARTPEGVLRSAPPRCPSRDRRCTSSRSTRRQLAGSGRTPKGPPWLPTPTRKPLGVGSGQTDSGSMRETGRDEVPTRPEGRAPTWMRRVRGRTA